MRKAITLLSAAALFAAQGQAQVENSEWKDMAGSSHTMVLDKDGYLWASGSNGYGQIGNGKCGDYEFNYEAPLKKSVMPNGNSSALQVSTLPVSRKTVHCGFGEPTHTDSSANRA